MNKNLWNVSKHRKSNIAGYFKKHKFSHFFLPSMLYPRKGIFILLTPNCASLIQMPIHLTTVLKTREPSSSKDISSTKDKEWMTTLSHIIYGRGDVKILRTVKKELRNK